MNISAVASPLITCQDGDADRNLVVVASLAIDDLPTVILLAEGRGPSYRGGLIRSAFRVQPRAARLTACRLSGSAMSVGD